MFFQPALQFSIRKQKSSNFKKIRIIEILNPHLNKIKRTKRVKEFILSDLL